MNLLAWLLSLSTSLLLVIEATQFHKASVCRQKAWGKSFESLTRGLFPKAQEKELRYLPGCNILITREQNHIRWKKPLSLKSHLFEMNLKGKL
jgi:hypothetical protein